MIFVGIDWAEAHHDVCVVNPDGEVLGKMKVEEGIAGMGRLHTLLAGHATEANEVVVGIETDRGLMVGWLLAAGYQVYAINPLSVSHYRERHSVSGAKSDKGDAFVLAELVRLDRHNHRQVAGDSDLAEAVKILARNHQNLIWTRQRQSNRLRNTLRESWVSSATTELGSPIVGPDGTMPACAHHQGIGYQANGHRPRGPQRASGRCALPVGVLRAHQVRGCPRLLRRPSCPRPPTTKRCAAWAIAWWASCTAAFSIGKTTLKSLPGQS